MTDDFITALGPLAEANPDRLAFQCKDMAPMRLSQLQGLAQVCRSKLGAAGIRPNSRIGLLMASRVSQTVAFFVLQGAATLVPLNPAMPLAELSGAFARLRLDAIVVEDANSDLKEFCRNRGIPIILHRQVDAASLGGFCLEPEQALADVAERPAAAVIYMTSGSTGVPKATQVSHRAFLTRARTSAEVFGLGTEDSMLAFAPAYTPALFNQAAAALYSGASVTLFEEIIAPVVHHALSELGVTTMAAAPTVVEQLVTWARDRPEMIKRKRLRYIRTSSFELTPKLQAEAEAVLGVPCLQGYATSETGLICMNRLSPAQQRVGSVGWPFAADLEIRDRDGTPADSGQIFVKGDTLFDRYVGDPETSAHVMKDGWYATGDLGQRNADGSISLLGKLHDVINRGGEKISPVEVEEALLRHPLVTECLCFPVPHPSLSQVPVAVVVTTQPVSSVALKEFLAAHLARFKLPTQIKTVLEIAREPTGKMIRKGAAQRYGMGQTTEEKAPARKLDPIAVAVRSLWSQVLSLPNVPPDESFAQLGGDSLKAVELILAVEEALGIRLQMPSLFFEASTVSGMAAKIADLRSRSQSLEASGQSFTAIDLVTANQRMTQSWGGVEIMSHPPVRLFNETGDQPPLFWCFNQAGEAERLAKALGTRRPIYALRSLRDIVSTEERVAYFREIAEIYGRAIAQFAPSQGVFLGGNCGGGALAEWIAQALSESGYRVRGVLLLEHEPVLPCSAPLVMFFGAESPRFNPFLQRNDPETDWVKLHADYRHETVPGAHGAFMQTPNIDYFAAGLTRHLQALSLK